jgi:hypothetical protein
VEPATTILDYNKPERRFPLRLIVRIGIIVGLLLLALILTPAIPYVRIDYKICQECGIHRTEWHYFDTASSKRAAEKDTPVSAVLAKWKFPPHAHRFINYHSLDRYFFGGRRWSCSFHGVNATADHPWAAALLDGLYSTGQTAAADDWRRRLLDRSTARETLNHFRGDLDIPFDGFASPDEFLTWQRAHPGF